MAQVVSAERGWLLKAGLILLTGIIQSLSIAGVGVARAFISPAIFTTLRIGIASLALGGLFLLLRPEFHPDRRAIASIGVLGLLNAAVPLLALAVALTFISTSLAAALFQTAPVFTVILASFFLPGERLNAPRALGTLTAVAGAAIVILAGASALGMGPQPLIGEAIIVLSAFALAVGVVFARARVRDVPPLVLAGGQVFVALGIITPLALVLEGVPALAALPPLAWAATALAGLTTPAVGFWLFYYIVERYSASLAAFTGITTPLFSAAIGVALLGEVFTLPMAAGTLLLLSGVLIISRSY